MAEGLRLATLRQLMQWMLGDLIVFRDRIGQSALSGSRK